MNKYIIPDGNSQPYIGNCYTPSQAQPGTVWFDSGTQSFSIYDGQTWIPWSTPRPVLAWEAEQAIDHVVASMHEQSNISEMAAKYPLVAEALGQLEVAMKLCQNIENNGDE